MTAIEFHETMLRLLRREPFEPFDIELTDGRIISVSQPEEIATNGGGAAWGQETGDIVMFNYNVTRRLGSEQGIPATV